MNPVYGMDDGGDPDPEPVPLQKRERGKIDMGLTRKVAKKKKKFIESHRASEFAGVDSRGSREERRARRRPRSRERRDDATRREGR